mgnify:CR=1 FL=1
MLDLDTQLRDYFEATTPAVEMDEIAVQSERVAPAPQVVRTTRKWLPGWAVAVLATALVVAAVGGGAWLLGALGPNVDVAVTIPGIPSTIVTIPANTAPGAAAVARGSGPEIQWTQAVGAPQSMSEVVWFDDAFYGLGQKVGGPILYRSSDGAAWEIVEGFADLALSIVAGGPNSLVAGTEGILICLTDPSPHVLTVVTSVDGDTWRATQIEVVVPLTPDGGNTFLFSGPLAAGPAGFLVSAKVEAEFDFEGLIADEFGWEVIDDLATLQVAGDRILFSTQDGTEYELFLSDVGLTQADLAEPGAGARAWWSPDGMSWQASVPEGPMLSPGFGSAVPVADGFLVTRIGVGLWKTTDGTSWEEVDPTYSDAMLLEWNGTVLEYRTLGRNLRVLGSSEALPVSEAFDVEDVYPLEAGEAGIIAALGQFAPRGESGSAPVVSIVFSPDGVEWRRSVFEEGARPEVWIGDFAVGPDRVLMLSAGLDGSAQTWVGVPEQ